MCGFSRCPSSILAHLSPGEGKRRSYIGKAAMEGGSGCVGLEGRKGANGQTGRGRRHTWPEGYEERSTTYVTLKMDRIPNLS